MRRFIIITIVQILFFYNATSQGYVEIKADTKITTKTFTYTDTLKLDYYSLNKNIDKQRPLLVIVHGGGFAGGKRNNPLEVNFSKKMASNGYAVASISYRLTRKGKSFGCDCPAEDKIKTFVAVSEDITEALLYLHKRANSLQFDLSKTILIGSSAGAEGVLNTVFMRNHYRFNHIDIVPIAGVVSLAGAMIDKEYITEQNMIPALFIHGMKDKLVPFGTAPHHYCSTDSSGYVILEGAEAITSRLRKLNSSYILAVDPAGNHDWANLGYAEIPLVDMFIQKLIIKKGFMQNVLQLNKTE